MNKPEIPDFDLIRTVGSGGYGQVWMATNRTTGRLLAVKVIPLLQNGQASAAIREIGSITRLEANLRCRHPNLLPIHHVGKTADHLFYVMDLADDVRGGPASENPDYQPATLQSRLRNSPLPLGEGQGVRAEEKVASGQWPVASNASSIHHSSFNIQHSASNPQSLIPNPSTSSPLPTNLRSVPGEGTSIESPEICVDYARQLLAGLASLHAAGMVHRDVKPANCLFVEGKLKLADFGLLTEAHPLVSRVGTQKYMPPDGRMDMRADVYAAGLVIYQMITGLPVDEFPRLGHRAGEIAADRTLTSLLGLVLQACEREPERRFADARPMLAALDAPAKIAHRPPRRRTFVAACAVVFMGVVWGTWMTVPRRVAVSFITDPYEAHVFLDNSLQVDPEGVPYRTPCTIEDIPSGTHRVAFEREGVPRWEDGEHDFAQTRQIVSRRTP